MNFGALFVFLGITVIFSLLTIYIFSRLRAIRIDGDASRLIVMVYVIAATVITVATLILLIRP